MQRNLLFIVNPNAGKKISEKIIGIIQTEFPSGISYQISVWKDKNNFAEIERQLKSREFTDAIAVGGDGTVNQVAKSILGTDIALGIVPIGSGNGLARSLGLSMNTAEVIRQIVKGEYSRIDQGFVNGRPFFCTSGVGFDAHIGNLFASSKKRGLSSYIKITCAELLKYRARTYTVTLSGKSIRTKAFLITVANAGQYGNDFYIAPKAEMLDGKFHVSILKPFKFYHLPGLLSKILKKKADESRHIETLVGESVEIIRENEDTIHFDGEPALERERVVYKCMPLALKVIVGERFNKIPN